MGPCPKRGWAEDEPNPMEFGCLPAQAIYTLSNCPRRGEEREARVSWRKKATASKGYENYPKVCEIEMDSKKGRSEMQMDVWTTIKGGTAAGKGKTRREPSARKKIEMNSKKGMSGMQMDAGATSKDGTAAGKGKTRREPSARNKKLVPVKGKKAEKPNLRKKATMVREPRRPPYQYELTMPVYGTPDVFNTWWMRTWGKKIGSMEQKTTIPSVRFTDVDNACKPGVGPISTLQILEAKISPKDSSGLTWPLHVYGYIAARDLVDYKRNIIFEREEGNCQIITEACQCLALTGPVRAVVLVDPVYFEVDLKVKGTGQSEDQDLIYIAESFIDSIPSETDVYKCVYTNNISKLELTFGHIISSVEAAVSMKVINGSWPDGFGGSFTAKTASINDMTIGLLQVGYNNELPLSDDGMIKLERHVVCAELEDGEYLEVSVSAYGVGGQQLDDGLHFTPQDRGRVKGILNVDSCEIEVTVTWSLIQWL